MIDKSSVKECKISLREITKSTVWDILQLTPSENQKQFVASNAVSIAEAYFQQDYAWFRAIYADNCPVGFLMIGINSEENFCFLWRFMIDQKYQKNGFGRGAIKALLEHLKVHKNIVNIITSYHQGEGNPSGFYRKMGFAEADEEFKQNDLGKRIKHCGEIILQLRLY